MQYIPVFMFLTKGYPLHPPATTNLESTTITVTNTVVVEDGYIKLGK